MKKKRTKRDIIDFMLRVIWAIIMNVVIFGILFIMISIPLVDYLDGYANPGILFWGFELTILVTIIDLLLMNIHYLWETITGEFKPRIYIGMPWNYWLSEYAVKNWF